MDFQHFTTSDQVQLAFSIKGSGQPIVFLSGYGGAGEDFFPQVNSCVKAGYKAIVFDRRSHGYSENPVHGHSMQRHGQDLAELLDYLGLIKPILVGQSMGASTIFSYLNQYGEDNCRGAFILDQTPKIINSADWEYGMYNSENIDFDHYLDGELPNPFYKLPKGFVLPRLLVQMKRRPKFDFAMTKPLFLDHMNSDWRELLQRLSMPIHFLAGEHSPMWPAAHAEASAALCVNGTFSIIQNAGHAVNLEKAKETNQTLQEFTKRLS